MNRLIERARGSVRVQQQATRIRALRNRWVDQPLIQVERARRQLAAGDLDILYFGDSSCVTWTFDDPDRTLIPELVAQRLNGSVATIAGPGYGANVFSEVVRLLGTMDQRPRAVVLTVTLRPNVITHVSRHPQFSYDRSVAAMRRVKSARHRIRAVGRGGVTNSPQERAEFMATPIPTRWGGEITVGEFRDRLQGQGPPPWPPEIEAIRFNYFHGEIVPPDHRGFAEARELAQRLKEYGVPVVPFWGIPPMERGELNFPGEFEKHVREQFAMLEGALADGYPGFPSMVDVDLDDVDFEDSQNGNEHYRFSGRVKIADAIVDRIRGLDNNQEPTR